MMKNPSQQLNHLIVFCAAVFSVLLMSVSASAANNSINSYLQQQGLPHNSIQTNIWSGYPKNDYENGRPEGVVVHETANDTSNINSEMKYQQNNYGNAFVHTFIDNNNIINVANTDYLSWGSGPKGNAKFVQFEQVRVHSKDAFARELGNAAYYTTYILKKYNLPITLATPQKTGSIWMHADVSNYLGGTDHTDPVGYWSTSARNFFGTNYTSNDFLELVRLYSGNVQTQYDKVLSTQTVNYRAVIDQSKRNDGVYTNGAYHTSAKVKRYGSAKTWDGRMVQVTQEVRTSRATYVRFTINGTTYFADKLAFAKLLTVNSSRTVSYKAYIDQRSRKDGVYFNAPYRTTANSLHADVSGKNYNGQAVTVLEEANVSNGATYAKVRTSSRTFWIDKQALSAQMSFDRIISSTTQNYSAKIVQTSRNDGVYYYGPYNTSAKTIKANTSGRQFNNHVVTVIKEAKTVRSTYAQVRDGATTFWIDKRGIQR